MQRLFISIAVVVVSLSGYGQRGKQKIEGGRKTIDQYLSVGVGVNQSTFYISQGIFAEGELTRMWEPTLYPSPEVSFFYNIENERHTVAAGLNVVYYQRILAVAIPLLVRYDYEFLDYKYTPFFRVDAGYSLFLTTGAYYDFGLGYKLGKTIKTAVTYNNQMKNNAILEDNEFVSGRVASMSFRFELTF